MRWALVSIILLSAACGGSATTSAENVDAGGAALGTCKIPTDTQCTTARAQVRCNGSNGVTADCLSDDPSTCAHLDSMPGGVTFTCSNVCTEKQYAAACGSIGPGPHIEPPAGCETTLQTPAGVSLNCCPCGP
ncbi:MAG: hypothetical protein HY898_23935 [Deltaproteobacteria bacterium]|nr:hypothetical protein [Deltaproteobacteria bacterium]